ncbi:UNVERIFIED_CONTAM: hypothetical protein NCL1_48159 [Trichonephila clavipes]
MCNRQRFQRPWNSNENSLTICGLMTHCKFSHFRLPLNVNSRIRSRLYIFDNVVNERKFMEIPLLHVDCVVTSKFSHFRLATYEFVMDWEPLGEVGTPLQLGDKIHFRCA